MNLEGKIDLIKNSVTAIKQAILGKNVTPSGNLSTYADAINNIVTPNNQSKTVTSNGVVRYDTGYTGLEQVTVNVNQSVQDKTINANGEYMADSGYIGLGTVTIDVQPDLTTKTITANGTYNASSDSADGYSSVTVNVANLAETLIDGSATTIDTNVSSIRGGAFANCEDLETVVLRSNTVVDLSDDSIFENTPIEDKTGNIYVLDTLINQYKLINISWSTPTTISVGNYNWEALTYDNNKFVALGIYGHISTSTDGITWTAATQNPNLSAVNNWQDMIYNGTKFVALSSSGYISTSTDGTTWATVTQNTNLGNHNWRTLAYGNSIFVALGESGYISTSTDGVDWITAILKLPRELNWESIVYNNTEFIALSTTGEIYTSVDGINWASKTNNLSSRNWQDMVYDGNEIIALSSTGNIAFSVDGGTWINSKLLSNNDWESLSYDGTKFVALTRSNGYSSYSNLNYNFLPISQLSS